MGWHGININKLRLALISMLQFLVIVGLEVLEENVHVAKKYSFYVMECLFSKRSIRKDQ